MLLCIFPCSGCDALVFVTVRVVASFISVAVTGCKAGLLMFLLPIGWLLVLFGFPDETVLVRILSEKAAGFDDGSWVIALVVCNSGDIVDAVEVVLFVFIVVVAGIVLCIDLGINEKLIDAGLKVVLSCVTVAVEVNVTTVVVPVLAVITFVAASETTSVGGLPVDWSVEAVVFVEWD